MIGITFTLKDGHTVEVREGNSACCPWGLNYAHEIGVSLAVMSDITTWALIDDEEVYIINHMWHQKTRSDMYLDEWLEENGDTYAGKLSNIKADIYRVKEEEELVKTMTKNEKAAFFAGKRGARMEFHERAKKARMFDEVVSYLKVKMSDYQRNNESLKYNRLETLTQISVISDILEFIKNLENE